MRRPWPTAGLLRPKKMSGLNIFTVEPRLHDINGTKGRWINRMCQSVRKTVEKAVGKHHLNAYLRFVIKLGIKCMEGMKQKCRMNKITI